MKTLIETAVEVPTHLIKEGRVKEWNLWHARQYGNIELALEYVHKVDLTGLHLVGVVIKDTIFEECILNGVNMSDAKLANVQFENCQVGDLVAFRMELYGVAFSFTKGCKVQSLAFWNCKLVSCNVKGVYRLDLFNCRVDRSVLTRIKTIKLSRGRVSQTAFQDTSLSSVEVRDTILEDIRFDYCQGRNSVMLSGQPGSEYLCYMVMEITGPKVHLYGRRFDSIEECVESVVSGEIQDWEDYSEGIVEPWRKNVLLWLAYAADSIGAETPTELICALYPKVVE